MPSKERYHKDKEYYREYTIKKKQQRREQGLCVKCGRPIFEGAGTKINCIICLEHDKARIKLARNFF